MRRACRKSASPTKRTKGYTPDFQINRAIIDAYCSPETIVCIRCRAIAGPAPTTSVDLNHDPRLAIFRQTDNESVPFRARRLAVLQALGSGAAFAARCDLAASVAHVGGRFVCFPTAPLRIAAVPQARGPGEGATFFGA